MFYDKLTQMIIEWETMTADDQPFIVHDEFSTLTY